MSRAEILSAASELASSPEGRAAASKAISEVLESISPASAVARVAHLSESEQAGVAKYQNALGQFSRAGRGAIPVVAERERGTVDISTFGLMRVERLDVPELVTTTVPKGSTLDRLFSNRQGAVAQVGEHGTAFSIAPKIFATADHVVFTHDVNPAEISMRLSDNTIAYGRVIGRDVAADLSLIEVPGASDSLPYISVKQHAGLRLGDSLYAIGHPNGHRDRLLHIGKSGGNREVVAAEPLGKRRIDESPGWRYGTPSFALKPAAGVAEIRAELQHAGGSSGSFLLDQNGDLAAILTHGVKDQWAFGPSGKHLELLSDSVQEFGIPRTGWWKVVSDGRVRSAGRGGFDINITRVDARVEHEATMHPDLVRVVVPKALATPW